MNIIAGIKSFFGFEGVADTAIKIVEKLSGTDWTDKEKSEFILRYHEATKHLSPARRVIAILFTLGFALFGFGYFVAGFTHAAYVFFATDGITLEAITASQNLAKIKAAPLLAFQNDCITYAETTLKNPISIILGFYFAIGAISKLKS